MIPEARRKVFERWHLDAWLVEATRGLAQESRERVREEIADHFHEALDAGVEGGLDANEAAEQAIESLGPASRARRHFRRTYLTTTEWNLVRSFAALPAPDDYFGWPPRHARMVLSSLILVISAIRTVAVWRADGFRTSDLMLLGIISAGVLTLWRVPSIYRAGRQRVALLLGAAAELGVWGGYLFGMTERGWGFPALLLTGLFVVLIAVLVPLLPKLQRRARTN